MLGFTALAVVLPAGTGALSAMPGRTASPRRSTPTPRRPATTAARSPGISANTPFWNTTIGIAMMIGRFLFDRPGPRHRRLAGGEEDRCPPRPARSRRTAALFVGLVVGVILIVGGLTFFPALALGPVVEHFAMNAGTLY